MTPRHYGNQAFWSVVVALVLIALVGIVKLVGWLVGG
jgi:hypothetical protein